MARKEKIYHYIYKTTNLLNGRYYYGMHSTDNIDDGYMGSGKRLKRSVNKHGVENHKVEILEFLPDRKALSEREKEIINLNEVSKKDCMNLMMGGNGGAQLPEKQRNWIIAGSNGFTDRLKNDDEFREKNRNHLITLTKENHKNGKYNYNTFTNKKHTNETKKLMSLKGKEHTGERNSQYGTCWITKDLKNKKIKKCDLLTYFNDGWKRGRIL
jgi:hypothetical protein